MILERPASARGQSRADWLDSRHAFSFSRYYDPQWMGFGPLRVINEDVVAPGAGFAPHRHANMEILSYVLDGELSHRDDSGGGGVIGPGELQWMGAGHGIEHSEFNASQDRPVHFLQIWIQPDRLNAVPAYAQREAPAATAGWVAMASPDGADGSLAIRQDARMWLARLEPGARVDHAMVPTRRYWLQVVRGQVRVAGRELNAGDALGLVEEAGMLAVEARGDAQVLLFDLPL
jgi:redox-sensitive bicupin YhaK (pirin superfamily)